MGKGNVTVHPIEIDLQPQIREELAKIGDDVVADIKANAPVGRRRGKKYRDGWTWSWDGVSNIYVHNETNWQLTHLLEKGHVTKNRWGKVGWARAIPHIHPVYERAKEKFYGGLQKLRIAR
ncbi:MAG: HK97 gp10 family phage protein [Coriobacteriia bacterium]|nr:HK97 gp10 family phage protein [Coriobacteriia bacterium]